MYTANTGIWQTVWLEPVPETRIESLHIVPDVDAGEVRVTATLVGRKAERRSWHVSLDGDQPGRRRSRDGPAFASA